MQGHAAADVMNYTPKQIGAFLIIAAARRRRELAEQLHIQTLAAQGKGEAIKDTMRELNSDG